MGASRSFPWVPGADPINLTYFCVDVDLLQDQANFFFYELPQPSGFDQADCDRVNHTEPTRNSEET